MQECTLADEWAYNWVLDKWREFAAPPNPLVFKKRCTLVVSLFALIAINHVRRPRNIATGDHPNTVDRLLRFLVKHANEDNGLDSGLAWAVAFTAIHLHISQILDEPLPIAQDFRDYFNDIRRRFPSL